MSAVEVCPICDIEGCRHIRERKGMTGPTREEVERYRRGKYLHAVLYAPNVKSQLRAYAEWTAAADNEIAALRDRAEAAEAATFRVVTERNAMETALTEARDEIERLTKERDALAAASWIVGRDAAVERAQAWLAAAEGNKVAFEKLNVLRQVWSGHSEAAAWIVKSILRLTPPADATAALQAVKDAEWNAAIEGAAKLIEQMHGRQQVVWPKDIRALRRNPKEGEA